MATSVTGSRLAHVLSHFEGVEPRGDDHAARCSAHEDRRPSLSITEGRDGRILLHCHAGCTPDAVLAAARLTMADLFPERERETWRERGPATPSRIVATYDYVDEQGALLYQVCRKEPKAFPQRRPDPDRAGAWLWGLDKVRRVLYRLPELRAGLAAGRLVLMPEGEKDVDALIALGLIATTNPGGAGKWRPEFTATFAGARVVLLPDHDEPGRDHAELVARALQGVAREVRVVHLPGLPDKGDVSDWLAAGGTRLQLERLVAATPVWAPPPGAPAPPGPARTADAEAPERTTDLGNSRRLVRRHGGDLRHVSGWGWLYWTGTHWRRDDTGEVQRRAKDAIRAIYGEAAHAEDLEARQAIAKWARKSEDAARVAATVKLAQSEPELAIRSDVFDLDPFLLTVDNGTLDLRTGVLHPHRREDLITRAAPAAYDPAARCPQFLAFLDRIFAGNAQLIAFVQRAIGYMLTGSTAEHAIFFWIGSGANGKSVLLELVRELVGPYGATADFAAFLERASDGPRNDLARLAGVRMVSASESDEGKRLAEGTVKLLSGGDTITARFLHQEFFEFRPQFKVVLVSNHKPRISGTDEGIWRRIKLVPFTVTIPVEERDPGLKARLLDERAGILAWAVAGCRAWQAEGLGVVADVAAATQQYRDESDDLGEFFDLHCEFGPSFAVASKPLYDRYAEWAGKGAMTPTKFGRVLNERGFTAEKRGSMKERKMWRVGLRLLDNPEPTDESDREGSEEGRVRDRSGVSQENVSAHMRVTGNSVPTLPNPATSVSLFGAREAEDVVTEAVSESEDIEL